jgi:hypothetical protein
MQACSDGSREHLICSANQQGSAQTPNAVNGTDDTLELLRVAGRKRDIFMFNSMERYILDIISCG